MATTWNIFCGVTPGLEPVLVSELARLLPGVNLKELNGGVEFRGDETALWNAAHRSRIAESVRIRLAEFDAHNFDQLERQIRKQAWAAYFPRDSSPEVKATSRKSALYHTGAVEERVQRWISDRLSSKAAESRKAHGTVYVRMVRDTALISIDAVGDLLHRRGYRTHVGKAPLRETLAAACIALANQHCQTQGGLGKLWDPFCGAGTIPLEFAAAKLDHPAAVKRDFAFRHWPGHSSDRYQNWLSSLQQATPQSLIAYGSDLDASAVKAAETNATAANLADACSWHVGDFATLVDAVPTSVGVVSNLPYGVRTKGGQTLYALRRRLGELLKQRSDLRPAVFLTTEDGFASATGSSWDVLARFSNRGVRVALLAYRD